MKTRIVLTGALAICIFTFFVMRPPTPAPLMPELLRSELTLVDNRLFPIGHAEPFDGWVIEKYSNGELRSRSRVARGLFNGASEGWDEAGRIIVRENFLNSVSHGPRTKWHPNGQKMSEATIENGKVIGEFRRWHENGEVAELLHLKNGELDGESWAFYPSGFVRGMARHRDGSLVQQEAWKDGEHKVAVK